MKLSANSPSTMGRRKSGLPLLAYALLAGISMPALTQAQYVKGAEKSLNNAPAAGVASVTSSQGLGPFGRMLPVGQRNLDVKIPSFKDGRPNSLMRAGSMTRLDDDNMAIEKMDIRMFGLTKDRDVRVQLITGTYNMPSQILSSEERSRISREDFQMEGDSMVFDTKTQQGKMTGNVRMVIYDTESFTSGDGLNSGAPPLPGVAGSPAPEMESDEDAPTDGTATPVKAPAPLDVNAPAAETPKDPSSSPPLAPKPDKGAAPTPPVAPVPAPAKP